MNESKEERLERLKTIGQILVESEWLTAENINARQADPPINEASPASEWKHHGRIYSISHHGKEFFASYQFDAAYQPLPIIKEILTAFGKPWDSWKLAAWFHYPNGWLAEAGNALRVIAPKDALDRREDILNALAKRKGTYVG